MSSEKRKFTQAQHTAQQSKHDYKAGVRPEGSPKMMHYPCETCGLSRKASQHRAEAKVPAATALLELTLESKGTFTAPCPECRGSGKVTVRIVR